MCSGGRRCGRKDLFIDLLHHQQVPIRIRANGECDINLFTRADEYVCRNLQLKSDTRTKVNRGIEERK